MIPRCSRSIFSPIATKIRPPNDSTLVFRTRPNLPPIWTPKKDSENVTTPVTIAGIMTETCRRERLRPTVKASMLVATDNISSTLILSELTNVLDSFLMES